MDNSEFETRAFADPYDTEQDFLEALSTCPERQQLLDEIRTFNARLGQVTGGIPTPPELCARLKAAVTEAASPTEAAAETVSNVVRLPSRSQPARLVVAAAALVLGIGMTYSTMFGSNQPSAAEIEFGQQVVNHVYAELDEIKASNGASLQQVNQAMGSIGGALDSDDAMERLGISFARDCIILPRNHSAHLVISGNRGAINIIIIDNSPVRREFTFSDDHFAAVVVPLENGNLVLVGEKSERLTDFQQVVDANLSWRI
ncbi:MAG: DUF3379 family protein [Gammaproteobacteria bacterium]|nr:DUF3379 family protein [Pseudomonadales bacterium]MCP5347271.1 DUF3379 family protein [Pseudomonadales bacterium]